MTGLLFRAPAPEATVLVSGAHLLDPRGDVDGPGDVLVRDGVIAEVGAPGSIAPPPEAERIDGAGRHLFPAFFDPHVHLRTPGQEHKEDVETGTRAAAAGGYCGVVAMPNTDPPLDSAPLLLAMRETARRDARVPVGFLPCISRGMAGEQLTDMVELRQAGALGFTDDGRPVVSSGLMRRALQYQRLCGGVLALHEEDPALSAGGAMHEGEVSAQLGIGGIPSVSESTMIARDGALAAYEGGRIHIQHLSALESVAAVAAAKAAGTRITAEASPHHLLLTDEDVRELDTRRKMNPPLRTERDRQAVIDALRSGVIDCIATDHAPHHRDDKDVPFEQAAFGTTGLETAFSTLYTELVRPGVLGLGRLVAALSEGARVLDLPVPEIAVGAPANLCLVDLQAGWQVGESGYESRSENCAFAGRSVSGRVLLTLADGVVAYRERAFALSAA
jgi:dihydroorotase